VRQLLRLTPALALLIVLVAACGEAAEPTPTAPEGPVALGALVIELTAEDGITLDARLWEREPDRVAIYLHEYRDGQTSWWPHASVYHSPKVSALTVDFRGHGLSEGLSDDLDGMVLDALAAVAFVRDRGYTRVMLVGAGMGGAVAVAVAETDPDVTVVGLSTPMEFDTLLTLEVLRERPDVAERVWLIAMRDDISAAHSLEQFREVASMGRDRTRLYPGRGHGVRMLDTPGGSDVRRQLDDLLERFWKDPGA
jgi:pimeloyl-ACP methyl ester carboxylesterase